MGTRRGVVGGRGKVAASEKANGDISEGCEGGIRGIGWFGAGGGRRERPRVLACSSGCCRSIVA